MRSRRPAVVARAPAVRRPRRATTIARCERRHQEARRPRGRRGLCGRQRATHSTVTSRLRRTAIIEPQHTSKTRRGGARDWPASRPSRPVSAIPRHEFHGLSDCRVVRGTVPCVQPEKARNPTGFPTNPQKRAINEILQRFPPSPRLRGRIRSGAGVGLGATARDDSTHEAHRSTRRQRVRAAQGRHRAVQGREPLLGRGLPPGLPGTRPREQRRRQNGQRRRSE